MPKPTTPQTQPHTWVQVAQRALGKQMDTTPTLPTEGRAEEGDEEMATAEPPAKISRREPQMVQKSNEEPYFDSDPFKDHWVEQPHVDQRLTNLEEEMGSVKEHLQQILQAIQTSWAPPNRQIPQKGTIPWPAEWTLQPTQIMKCPGDGNCLWHACMIWDLGHKNVGEQLAEQGAAFKQRTIETIMQNIQTHAHLWGATPDGVDSTLREWRDNWADSRVLLSIGFIWGVNILLLDAGENLIEIIAPEGAIDPKKPLWIIHFHTDHYDAVHPQPPEDLARVCEAGLLLSPGDMLMGV